MIKSRINMLEYNKPFNYRERVRRKKDPTKIIYQVLKDISQIGYQLSYVKWWVSELKRLNTTFSHYGLKNDRGSELITRTDRLLN